ncbi:MAG TPA: hypothetical protein VGN37_17715 [Actinocatenispora sp.]
MKLLRIWTTAYAAGTWRRFGYVLLGLPLGIAGLVLALAGRWRTVARWQAKAARWADLRKTGTPTAGRTLGAAALSVATGLAGWAVTQYLGFLVLYSVGYPLRNYVSAGGDTAPLVPWAHLSVHAGSPNWASEYHDAWGGPTLAGAWAVHAALVLLTLQPVLAWAVRGLARLQRSPLRPTAPARAGRTAAVAS